MLIKECKHHSPGYRGSELGASVTSPHDFMEGHVDTGPFQGIIQ